MTRAEISSGVCGFTTIAEAHMNGSNCTLSITSDCEAIQRLAAELTHVDPFQEISFQGEAPLILQLAAKHCPHAACPVPVGIIKAVEVETGLALPADVTIQLSNPEDNR